MTQSWRSAWLDRSGAAFGGGSGGGTNTVTQSEQIPAYEQQFSSQNQQLAQSLGATPYPQYQGALVQGFSPQQEQGMQMAGGAAGAYQPDLSQAQGILSQSFANSSPFINEGASSLQSATNPYGAQAQGLLSEAGQLSNPGVYNQALVQSANAGYNPYIGQGQGVLANAAANYGPSSQNIASYMSPYVQQSLQPQILNLQTQLGQEQNQINSQAAQANAFGDARQGAEQALQNYYGNQALSGVVGQGYNTAYNSALNTALGEQQNQANIGAQIGNIGLQQGQLMNSGAATADSIMSQLAQQRLASGQALGNLGQGMGQLSLAQGQDLANLGLGVGQMDQSASAQMANLGGLNQSLGITGANAMYNAGQQQQTLGQQELNQAYQQFLNQVNWPYQMLNIQESALSNSPYNMVNATTVPQANMAAQGFGSSLAGIGSLASLLGGGSGSGSAPFGGTSYPS